MSEDKKDSDNFICDDFDEMPCPLKRAEWIIFLDREIDRLKTFGSSYFAVVISFLTGLIGVQVGLSSASCAGISINLYFSNNVSNNLTFSNNVSNSNIFGFGGISVFVIVMGVIVLISMICVVYKNNKEIEPFKKIQQDILTGTLNTSREILIEYLKITKKR